MSTAKYHTSLWLVNSGIQETLASPLFPKLQHTHRGAHYDVVVIGAGIVGCATAYFLKQAGKRVALVEARTVGNGVTGFSTAKLSAQQGNIYSMLANKHGMKAALDYYKLNVNGINAVEEISKRHNIACELERRAHLTYTCTPGHVPSVRQEFQVCAELGIDCRLVEKEELQRELPQTMSPEVAIAFDNQAQFNPYKFCVALSQLVEGGGSEVFELSRVTSVESSRLAAATAKATTFAPGADVGEDLHSTSTPAHTLVVGENETQITGDNIVVATHLPILDRSLHFAVLEPSRSLCIAVRVNKDAQPFSLHNMYISAEKPSRSLRMSGPNDEIVVVCGEGYKQGDVTDTDRLYQNLEDWAKQHLAVTEVVARWSALDYYNADHIPYAGYLDRGTNSIFTATGFSKWGLASGVSSAQLISDLILGKPETDLHKLVDARRWDLLTQWKGLVAEGWHTTKHMIGDKLKHTSTPLHRQPDITSLQRGCGSVVSIPGIHKKVGAYRDFEGMYHLVTPTCTHLGCDLVFNDGDRVWDCPCHGSQFDVDGNVIHGPATKPLCVMNDLKW